MSNVDYKLLERWRESQVIEKAARRLALRPASVRLFVEAAKTEPEPKMPRLVVVPSFDDR